MQIYEYENKETKDKARSVDVMSLLSDMAELEEFNGLIESKVYENWYELKRQLRDSLIVDIPQGDQVGAKKGSN